ncbi:hypothetical protein K7X08_021157 [Anisodus acutangulus]|uniref:Uncharacterized protein n=1 Tax=Anisodus acutangulus TaxID=402998 RepID=A0A9Q1LZB1_9SOLA|nr:hypothetical protein K7X08_021157 [Anisodus acutangulus]
MTQLAVSMKDVLREMNELKPAYGSSVQESTKEKANPRIVMIHYAVEKIWCTTDENTGGAGKTGCSEDFVEACNGLRNSLKQLEAELDQSDGTD